jgi:outer membrane beta-barrel protein
MRLLTALLLAAAMALAPMTAAGAPKKQVEDEQGPKTLAVQNRMHTARHEFGVWVGLLPMDAFTKGLTFTGAYTLHFNDLLAWEIAQFTYSIGIDTRLADELANLPQPLGATPFEVVRYYATSSFMIKPVYGKLAVFNRGLIYQEMFFVVGGGYGRLSITHRPVIDFGVGFRTYAGQHLSFRLDVRDYMYLTKDDVENEIWIALGIALSFGK